MDQHLMAVAFVCLAVLLPVVAILLVRQRQITTRLGRRYAALERDERIRDESLRHLVTARLPALVEQLQGRPAEVPGPLHRQLAGTEYERRLETIMGMFTETLDQMKTRADQSAKATLKATVRTVQSLASEQQLAISEMQDRHDDPEVLEGLMKIDHMNAQLGRRAQATAVLCGSWPGQQRSAASLADVVRGATSRIRDYVRVEVRSQVNVAVVSRVVEPAVLAIAELLDNATRHSQPNTSVEVNFQPTHNGVAIMIDDAGVAMDVEEQQQAARLLSGQESVDINRLGDPPQIGFAVVGVLAARYGFTVSVDTRSPYGGTRAVVFLPNELLTRVDQPKPVPTVPVPVPAPDRFTPDTSEEPMPDAPEQRPVTAGGLPKRQRVADAGQSPTPPDGQPLPAGEPAQSGRPPGLSARESAAGLGAWRRGTQSGRATVPSDSEGNPQA